MKSYFVYILASKRNGTLYIGVTNDLIKRVWQHKNSLVDGFTKTYKIHNLVYFEETSEIESAILREKKLKNWHRQWKINLINEKNPDWKDLYQDLVS
jgi:putative endonuclease